VRLGRAALHGAPRAHFYPHLDLPKAFTDLAEQALVRNLNHRPRRLQTGTSSAYSNQFHATPVSLCTARRNAFENEILEFPSAGRQGCPAARAHSGSRRHALATTCTPAACKSSTQCIRTISRGDPLRRSSFSSQPKRPAVQLKNKKDRDRRGHRTLKVWGSWVRAPRPGPPGGPLCV
jgi:hypothetical protein